MPTKAHNNYSVSFLNFFPPNVVSFISDGRTNFAFQPGEDELTEDQERILKQESGIDVRYLYNIKQVHGNRIIVIDTQIPNEQTIEEADGIITNMPNMPIAVRTADCLSIFLCDPVEKCIGVVHAGWKSTKAEILPAAVSLMHQTWGSKAEDIKAAFGPAIRECCYEVGDEFKTYFPQETFQFQGKFYFNNAQANRRQLEEVGVLPENILDCGICTFCQPGYHSYRRDGEKAGRMISVMVMKE